MWVYMEARSQSQMSFSGLSAIVFETGTLRSSLNRLGYPARKP